jgi:hypothetical protein
MPDFPPYVCTGFEPAGDAEFFDADGNFVTALVASRCYADYWATGNGYTWRWRDGIDPDDPTTWPDYVPPEDPAPEQ